MNKTLVLPSETAMSGVGIANITEEKVYHDRIGPCSRAGP